MSETKSEETKSSGPPRDTFRHRPCGSTTTMRPAMAVAHASHPDRLERVFCDGCRTMVAGADCVWCVVEMGSVAVTSDPVFVAGSEVSPAPSPAATDEPAPAGEAEDDEEDDDD